VIVSLTVPALLFASLSHCSAGSDAIAAEAGPDAPSASDGGTDAPAAPGSGRPPPVYCGTAICGSQEHCADGCCVQYKGSYGCHPSDADAGCFGEDPCDAGGVFGCFRESCKPQAPKCVPGALAPGANASSCNFQGSENIELECVCAK